MTPGAGRAAQLAEHSARLVGTDAGLARRAAQQATAAARAGGDGRSAALALRAHGRAALELGRLDEATRVLRDAVREAERAGAPQAAAEARITLAYALPERGRTADALGQLDRAAAVLRGRAAAPVFMQRGLVLWRCGRTDEALEAYQRALPSLRRGPDRLMEARLYNNRSLVYIDLGELALAEADLRRVADLARAEGQDGMAADAETNLGYLNLRRGDVPAALAYLDSAEATLRAQGVVPRELLLTRGELLLSVGAFDEARHTAERAIEQLTAAGWQSLLAEAELLRSQAQLAGDDVPAAQQAARAAVALFGRQRRLGWATVARYTSLRADERAGELTPHLRRRALREGRPAGRDGLARAGAGRAHRGCPGRARPRRRRHRPSRAAPGCRSAHQTQHRAADQGLVRRGARAVGHRPRGGGRAGTAGRVPRDGAAAGDSRRDRASGPRGQPRARRRVARYPDRRTGRVAAQGVRLGRALASRRPGAAAGAATGRRGAGRGAGRAAPGLRRSRGRAVGVPAGRPAARPPPHAGGPGTPVGPPGWKARLPRWSACRRRWTEPMSRTWRHTACSAATTRCSPP
jgi:tetratricopeptide (TPR) repeat protein